jgi:hypothetical protein
MAIFDPGLRWGRYSASIGVQSIKVDRSDNKFTLDRSTVYRNHPCHPGKGQAEDMLSIAGLVSEQFAAAEATSSVLSVRILGELLDVVSEVLCPQ